MKNFARYSSDNIYPDGIDASEAIDALRLFFLGDDWYITDPVSARQGNVYVVDAILAKFPQKYKKFAKKNGWLRQEAST